MRRYDLEIGHEVGVQVECCRIAEWKSNPFDFSFDCEGIVSDRGAKRPELLFGLPHLRCQILHHFKIWIEDMDGLPG